MWPVYYLEEIHFGSYADDNTPFVSEATLENSLFEGFLDNQMKTNPKKCELLMNVNKLALT